MYTKDKSNRITLRLNALLYDYVCTSAASIDVSPSEFLRMVITSSYLDHEKSKEDMRRENEQADINNLI